VWERFGSVASYNEPFFGSGAVLLGRPNEARIETVNDLDCYLANFWRALQHDPEGVAFYADGPVNEADLHARHRWLVEMARATAERVIFEPEFYDVKIAGWWVWGQCLWIGSGWCEAKRAPGQIQRPETFSNKAKGVHAKRPKLRERGDDGVAYRRWQGGGKGGGSGVHAPGLALQKPDLSGDSGVSGRGVHALGLTGGLYDYFEQLAARLRRVRVCCGDWRRVLTPSVSTYIGTCGVFLDPPYAHDLRERCYSEDHDISAEVRAWALEHGEDENFRIALCGYEGEHEMPASWECVPWKAHGGYSRSERGIENRSRERIWFSPHCLKIGLPFGDA
jgi:DNA adenine methylase